jgi:tetratricopeptide (TPR) repeat protein
MLGSELFLLGDTPAAVTVLQEASRLQPDLSSASNDLGAAQYTLGRHDEAEVTFRRSLMVEDAFEPRVNLALSLRELGRINEATVQLESAAAIGDAAAAAGKMSVEDVGGVPPEQHVQVLRLLAEMQRRQGRNQDAKSSDAAADLVEKRLSEITRQYNESF